MTAGAKAKAGAVDRSSTDAPRRETGRIVLQLGCQTPSNAVLEATFRMAGILGAEVDTIFVEDDELLSTAALPFTREISFSGRARQNFERDRLRRDLVLAASAMRRRLLALARQRAVHLRFDVVRMDPMKAMGEACASGPGPVVIAIAEPLLPDAVDHLEKLGAAAGGQVSIVIAGPRAKERRGPTIVLACDTGNLAGLVQMSSRLTPEGEDQVLLILGDTEAELDELELRLRRELGSDLARFRLALAETTRGEPQVVAEALRRLNAGLVIGRNSGQLSSGSATLKRLIATLECPLLLMR